MLYKLLHYFTGKDVDYPSGHALMDCQNFLLIIVNLNDINHHRMILMFVNGFYVISQGNCSLKKLECPKSLTSNAS